MVKRRGQLALLLCLPALTVLALTAFWPLARTILLSFTNAKLDADVATEWVGLENFKMLATDPDWWQAVSNTLLFAVVSVSLETVLGLLVALLLNAPLKGRALLRAAVLVPWAIPTIVSAKMWAWMFHDLYGVVNEILLSVGAIKTHLPWLADSHLAMVAIVIVDVWKTTPFMALLLLAGLQSIPKSLYEVARIDGVSPIRRFFSITLPLLKPALVVALIFRILDAMRVFDLVFVLTSNSRDSATMSVYARQQLVDFQDFGYGSAASSFIFLLIGLVTLVWLRLGRSAFEPEGGRS